MRHSKGIHHVTALAGDPAENAWFYSQVLGQRLVKKTVNFDDPGTYHLYFGDEAGSPGTLLTFFPRAGAARGRPGAGAVASVAYGAPVESLDFWTDRLRAEGVSVRPLERFARPVLEFDDPHGMALEIVGTAGSDPSPAGSRGPIPPEYALRGIVGAVLGVTELKPSVALLERLLDYAPQGVEAGRHRFGGERFLDLRVYAGPFRPGAGQVHHLALRADSLEHQAEMAEALRAQGFEVSSVKDRNYFRSIYFRELNGILVEIATDGPGFLVDESPQELGRNLRLPPWLEQERERLEAELPSIRPAPRGQNS